MLRSKKIDRVCCAVMACTLALTAVFTALAATGTLQSSRTAIGYENRLFDQSFVHTLDIVMNDWQGFLSTCTNEEYAACTVVIDGEKIGSAAIRAKGNTSLSSVASYGNDRYSFKIEFDHYETGRSYHGLDKLSLNNVIQDATYMKDYLSYTLMNEMGVAAPLCSYVQINVNGEPWGLYLAVEGVEDAFLRRNYGAQSGELYKPDSLSFGGGRGNGRDFDMEDFRERMNAESDETQTDAPQTDAPQTDAQTQPTVESGMPAPDAQGFAGFFGESPGAQFPGGAPPDMENMPDLSGMPGFGSPPDMSGMPGAGNASKGGFGGFGMGSDDVKLKYIDDDPASYENIFSSAKTDITLSDQTRLIAALKRLSEGDMGAIDTDSVAAYMAVHNFLCNGDSYTGSMIHNYYLYEKDGVMSMIPWDYNLAFGGFSGGLNGATGTVNTAIDSLVTSGGDGDRPMADWITSSDENLSLYHEKYRQFIDTVFTSGRFAEEFDRVTAMIAPYVERDATAFYSYDEFVKATETLKTFCLKRAESVRGQLDGTIPSTSAAQSGSAALIDASELNLSDMGGMNAGGMGGRGESFSGMNAGGRSGNGENFGGMNTEGKGGMRFSMSARGNRSASALNAATNAAQPETTEQADAATNAAQPETTDQTDGVTNAAQSETTEQADAATGATKPADDTDALIAAMPTPGAMSSGGSLGGSAGSSGHQSAAAMPTPAAPLSDASAAPSAPVDSSAAAREDRSSPVRQGGAQSDQTEQYVLIGISALALIVGIIIAKRYRRSV